MPKKIDKYALFDKLGYEPFEQQRLYHESKARFRIPICGRRFGKSIMAGRDTEPLLFAPNKQIWIIGPTYALAEKEFRVIWDDLMIKSGLSKERGVKKAYNMKQGEMFIKLPWNTTVECKSADKPETLVGEALDRVIMSEAAKHKQKTWDQYIRPALADKQGSADFPTTPEGYNWVYELWMLGQDGDPALSAYQSWRFPTWKNTVMFPQGREDPEIKLLERTLTEERFRQEIGAEFGAFVGKIFPEFQEEKNVVRHEFRPDWPNYIAFDFGFANPLAAVEFQVSPSDDIIVWREHYESRLLLEDHIRKMKERPQPEGYRIDCTFGDAADPEAVHYINLNLAPCIAMPESKQNWREGIDLMKSFMRIPVEDPDDPHRTETKYFVDPGCTNHIRELNSYRTKENIESRSESTAQGVAEKIDDHTIDAMRYALMHIFVLGARRHLNEVNAPVVVRPEGRERRSASDVEYTSYEQGRFTGSSQLTKAARF